MAYVPSTPQRPLPGAFMQTPAPARQQSGQVYYRPPVFRAPSGSSAQNVPSQQQSQPTPSQQSTTSALPPPAQAKTPIERAQDTINNALRSQTQYPELESYVAQGISSDYDIPTSPAWSPFQKVKTYDIPDKIFEQYNQAQVSTMMGLFAELNHAWIAIDNALYLWDYTHPNPELIGFEDQPNSITAVKLVTPRPKVFVDTITHLLVVATTTDIQLIGVSCQRGIEGVHSVQLYQTKMSVSIKGLDVNCIEGSKSGRIFFGGRTSDDVYEFTYQQEEGWFANRCGKINHVNKSLVSVLPTISFRRHGETEHVQQMVVDDTRNLLYTLSTASTIRVFHMKGANDLVFLLKRDLYSIKQNITHMVNQAPEGLRSMAIVSISPISATEASRLNLMVTTSAGWRIFLSATSGAYNETGVPTSMQVHHVKFPPPDPTGGLSTSQASQVVPYAAQQGIDANSKHLTLARLSHRFPPGYFFCFVQKGQDINDLLFMSAPDAGRITQPQDPTQVSRYIEFGQSVQLGGHTEDIGLVTPPFAASSSPRGFGNELAVQFDQPVCELAILTNNGVQTIRRRRLVDMFAAAIRYGGSEDGFEEEVRKFVRRYGRPEASATALAVACGQGSEVTPDSRIATVTDPEIIEYARKAFINFGGKATLNENSLVDPSASAVDNVRPSPRHEGIALYISRLVRSVWNAPILKEGVTPIGGLNVTPTVPLSKLQRIQKDLLHLQEFLESNKSFIDGLAGPEALTRVQTQQEEIALQGEHRALNSLVQLISSIIEGISFILVLFDEQVSEILLKLNDTSRQRVRDLSYEGLFCSPNGRELAKELVKAIVYRNIDKGSNVDTVAEALRRRCGSFCSAEDVVIFKAQEFVNKAAEAGATSTTSRALLNDSLALFEKVASSLGMEHLEWAVDKYIRMEFYAGAVRLALKVANQKDPANRALAWIRDGSPAQDPRREAYEARRKCYVLIQEVIQCVDEAASRAPEQIDGQLTPVAKYKAETYGVINDSDDEVFQNHLYDWYLSQGWSDRLLNITSPYVVAYLQRKSAEDVKHADLLWRYFAHYHQYFEAAQVQLQLGQSTFDLDLGTRIEYLSRAKANASTRIGGLGDMRTSRQSRQELLREVSDLLDLANIQEDLLQRIKADPRLSAERKPQVVKQLNGQILPLDNLYNDYADQAGYYDLCLLIYQVADHRNPTDIAATWGNWLDQLHNEEGEFEAALPYERMAERIRTLGRRLNASETTFPVPVILPLLLKYHVTHAEANPTQPANWALDIFIDLNIPYETLLSVLESMFYDESPPFTGRNRRWIAEWIVYTAQKWYEDSARAGEFVFGGEENAVAVAETLRVVLAAGLLDQVTAEKGAILRERVEQVLR